MHYDPESNLISIELAKGKIDHALELGNFLIHVDKNKKPLLMEILDGGKFVGQLQKIKKENVLQSMLADG